MYHCLQFLHLNVPLQYHQDGDYCACYDLLWGAPVFTSRKAGQHVLLVQVQVQVQGTFSFFGNLGTPHTWGPLIPGDLSYLGTSHTWGPLLPGDLSYLGTSHTWGPLIPGDLLYLGTSHSRLSLIEVWVIKFQTFAF